jgi:hypothetical protein
MDETAHLQGTFVWWHPVTPKQVCRQCQVAKGIVAELIRFAVVRNLPFSRTVFWVHSSKIGCNGKAA